MYLNILCLLVASLVNAQEYKQGFQLLEQEKFDEAALFFNRAIKERPTDITANICYGRAIGLAGQNKAAVQHFEHLYYQFQDKFEIKLNLAESYLWDNRAKDAKAVYEALIEEQEDNFVANFGFANANAALYNYEQAFKYINIALSLDSINEGALLSRKFIMLGLANQKKDSLQFDQASVLIDRTDRLYPNDRQVLFLKANLNLAMDLPSHASMIFERILDFDQDNFDANMGLAYTQLLLNNLNEAYNIAVKSLKNASKAQSIRGHLFVVTVLAAQKNFKKANAHLGKLEKTFGESLNTKLMHARLLIWGQRIHVGYQELVELNLATPNNYEIKMAMAEALLALKSYQKSANMANEAMQLQPGPDAKKLFEQARDLQRANLRLEIQRDKDNGGNKSNIKNIELRKILGAKTESFIQLERRDAENQLNNTKAEQSNIKIGSYHQILRNTNLMWAIGMLNATDPNGGTAKAFNGEILFSQKFSRFHQLGIGMVNEAHNYSVDLISNMILNRHYKLEYAYNQPNMPGVFAQFIDTYQSDDNKRKLFYGSAYYNFSVFPMIQIGLSHSRMTFKNNDQALYFSPKVYRASELFVKYSNKANQRNKFTIEALVALGVQNIEQSRKNNTQRLDILIGYRPNRRLSLEIGYQYSNAANVVQTGYKMNQLKLKSSYRI